MGCGASRLPPEAPRAGLRGGPVAESVVDEAPAAPAESAASRDPPTLEGAFKVVVYSAREYDVRSFNASLAAAQAAEAGSGGSDAAAKVEWEFVEAALSPQTARLAAEAHAVCVFVNDDVGADTVRALRRLTGVRLVLLRCAGFNNVDLAEAGASGLRVARVPEYSPYSVAEHAVALCMTLNRKVHKAYARNRDGNFSLTGLSGFDMHGKTVGVLGTGKIGVCAARIFLGFGCEVLAYNRSENKELVGLGVKYVPLDELCARSDVISMHAPLVPATYHIIDGDKIALMKRGVMVINTSRGGLLDTKAAIAGLKSGVIGSLGLDVYEEEAGLFFTDHSGEVIEDDVFQQLVNYPNVIVTGHQAFLTADALANIADHTLGNVRAFFAGGEMANEVKADPETLARAQQSKVKRQWGVLKHTASVRRVFYDPEDSEM